MDSWPVRRTRRPSGSKPLPHSLGADGHQPATTRASRFTPEEESWAKSCSMLRVVGRSPATMPGFHAGRPPRNKGRRYPANPPTVEEVVAVMRAAGDRRHGCRLRGLIVVLWRAGLRIHEALALNESDLDHRRGALLVRRGKGGRRREVGMDEWGWEHLQRWIDLRLELPIGQLFCVINGPTRGRSWSPAAARAELRRTAATGGFVGAS